MNLQAGTVFAGYRVIRRLGSGGMGAVYLAHHPRLPRQDALKILDSRVGDDPEFRARFAREAELAARLEHSNIVSIFDRGDENGVLWISMRFVAGTDVGALVAQGPLEPGRALRIVSEAARGLDAAHHRGLLHRDVKPANILVSAGDEGTETVRITDFGIARSMDASSADLTATGSVLATFAYAAPEQLSGERLDHRTDIYALGCSLYEMLTGRKPFDGRVGAAVIYAHLHEPPPRPSLTRPGLPPALDAVIARAMAKNRDERFDSCAELAQAARLALETGTVPPSGPLGGPRRFASGGASHPGAEYGSGPWTAPEYGSALSVPSRTTPGRANTEIRVLAITTAIVVTLAVVAVGAWVLDGARGGTVAAGPTTAPAYTSPSTAHPSMPPPTPTTPAADAWGPAAYIVEAFPGLLPPDPESTGYQGMRCALNDDTGSWLHCPAEDGGIHVNIRCDPSRRPVAPNLGGAGITDLREERWIRPSGSGTVRWGTDSLAGFGLLEVTFDEPGRYFCEVGASGGASGRDVYDRWWTGAPI